MQSSLKRQCDLKKVRKLRLMMSGHEIYLLSRSPYTRLVSFYQDKLRINIFNDDYWVRSQRIFFKPLGIEGCTDQEKYEHLRALSFSDFIQLLPRIYDKNRHLHPQHWLFRVLHHTRLLKMEQPEDLAFMQSQLGIDLSIRQNVTRSPKRTVEWTANDYRIVNELYSGDFDFFGHERNGVEILGSEILGSE